MYSLPPLFLIILSVVTLVFQTQVVNESMIFLQDLLFKNCKKQNKQFPKIPHYLSVQLTPHQTG